MTKQSSNPFSAPVQTRTKSTEHSVDAKVIDFGLLAKKWEGYRLIYNGVLVVWTLLLSLGLFGIPALGIIVMSAIGAVVANFFFFLGLTMDGYCQWIFRTRASAIGIVILVVGTLFTMFMAGSFLFEMKMMAK